MRAFTASQASSLHPDQNEDAFFVDEMNGTAGVFDGVGGRTRGDIASRLAADAAQASFSKQSTDDLTERIARAIVDGHAAIRNHGRQHPGETDLATTATIIAIRGDRLAIGSLGDSRACLVRNGSLERLTTDDRLLEENLRRGIITDGQVRRIDQCQDLASLTDPERLLFLQRNIVTKSLSSLWQEPAIRTVRVNTGDRILLTSDGIHDNLTDGEITSCLDAPDPAHALIERARSVSEKHSTRSKPDDLTAIVIAFD